MNEADFESLCQEFSQAYSVWRAAEQTGVEALFLRTHLRSLHTTTLQIEQLLESNSDLAVQETIWLKVTEVRTAFDQLQSTQIQAQSKRSLLDCFEGIPELLLLELDQALGSAITPEMLADFDDVEQTDP